MDTPPHPQSASIAELLQRGLECYGRNDVEAAVECWREVLRIDPRQPDALDYLESAGFPTTDSGLSATTDRYPIAVSSHPTAASKGAEIIDFGAVRAQSSAAARATKGDVERTPLLDENGNLAHPELKRLLEERRFEEALQFLYTARARDPHDASISRSIRLLRDRVADLYRNQLHDLDRVPCLAEHPDLHQLTSDERHVLGLVDGISSYGDILASSSLGRLSTLRALCSLQEACFLRTQNPDSVVPRSGPSPTSPASVPDSSRSPASASGSTFAGGPPSTRGPASSRDRAPTSTPHGSSGTEPGATHRTNSDDEEYAALFRRATEAYVLRNFELAVELFRACCERRPNDRRPRHNLKALLRRMGES